MSKPRGLWRRVEGGVRWFLGLRTRRWLYLALLAAVAALRLAVAASQRVYLLPEASGLDDMLMINAAMKISGGEWLGGYGALTIAKNMGFALWLALLHTLKIPLLLGNGALWVLCCLFAAWAMKPLFKGNVARLVLFAFLVFQPVSFAFYNQRAYRDAIFPALCLLLFAGVLGVALRLGGGLRGRGAVACALAAGLGLAGVWLTREDGAVLLVFAVCALALVVLYALATPGGGRKLRGVLCGVLPFVLLLGGIAGFSAANARQYEVNKVNDLTAGAFPRAYGLMAAISEAESGYTRYTPVTRAALDKMYAASPALAALRPTLESGPAYNGFANLETGEFGGSFYYALRLAAEYAGKTPTGAAAQSYWQTLYKELQTAVDTGVLQSAAPSVSTLPRWNKTLLAPTAAETGRGLLAVLTFAGCNPRPAESVGEQARVDEVAAYLHAPVQRGYVENTSQPYYSLPQRACFALCDALVWVYRVAVWPLLLLALWGMARALAHGVRQLGKRRRLPQSLLWGVLLLGLLLSVLLRAVVAAYMEVAAFNVSTYIMYLASALPPLLLFMAGGTAALAANTDDAAG